MINKNTEIFNLERPRLESGLFYFDKEIKNNNYNFYLIGVDEAGRGPLAGPVVACAAYIPENIIGSQELIEINDSKKLTPSKRDLLFKKMLLLGIRFGFGYSLPEEIDRVNILNATFLAMKKAVLRLLNYLKISQDKALILVDGPHIIRDLNLKQKAIIDGDAKSLSIACASIFAKVIRDNWMRIIDLQYPYYNFSKHKGYGTSLHLQKIKEYGVSPIHRKSFGPVKKIICAQ